MPISFNTPEHPGAYVHREIIPTGMTITAAAERLGIGRVALSNFLNGKSALSPEMALRLEKTFGADKKVLLNMQAAYDGKEWQAGEKTVAVRAFVPSFLSIRARQIECWADSHDARSRLPVLLRKLVHSTGQDIRCIDFPGYDNAERKGSDGFVEAGSASAWIPKGKSYWEFGTDQKPNSKANSDYAARLTSINPDERKKGTFIFVTPRNWPAKSTWEKQKNEEGQWKAVRALDASDLEQWLEQSVSGQIWFAEQLALPTNGYETLEQVWQRWACASEPHLTPEIFAPSIAAYREKFIAWLEKPSDGSFVVTADSSEEALAFLACLFNGEEEVFRKSKDRAVVFTSAATLRMLLASSAPFIPIVHSREVERELVDAYHRLHCIIFHPRNAVDLKADVTLDLLNNKDFLQALISMGIDEDEANRLGRESGHSPTILRRRLSKNAAIKTPVWAHDNQMAKALAQMVLTGAWHEGSEADQRFVSNVAGREYGEIEEKIAQLLKIDDSPIWSAGSYRGVTSKIDSLFAVAWIITKADLDRFFKTAISVLSEFDPALELPEHDRPAAVLFGKKRAYSDALRNSICETLVLLSVRGNDLFQERLGIDVEGQVTLLIRNLLTPLTMERLLSLNQNLPFYAEAAPSEFLDIIERDLQGSDPVLLGLLKPVDKNSLFSSPRRTGFLWALECLAWRPEHLLRVSIILARLSQKKIDDNWANKPEASLQSIFRSWMPQTAASVEDRFKVLEKLTERFSDIVWGICIEQIKPGSRVGFENYRPRWRNDASGAGQVVTYQELFDFNRKALALMFAWRSHNEKTLGDLVESLKDMSEEDQSKVWDLIDEWSQNADEADKAALRERIRLYAFTRQGHRRKLGETTRNRARKAYDSLQPRDLLIRHSWLFTKQWVQESQEELEAEDFNYRKREERIDKLRRDAMNDVWTVRGFEGVKELLSISEAAGTIGRYAAYCMADAKPQVEFVQFCLSVEGELHSKAEWCLQGFLHAIEEGTLVGILQATVKDLTPEDWKRLFICAPFRGSTWHLLDSHGEDVRAGYWKDVIPSYGPYTPAEITDLIDCLLSARRPRAAFYAVRMDFQMVETSRLRRMLYDIATVSSEPAGHFMLDSYDISKALDSLDGRAGVTSEEMAQLEFFFIEALDNSEHGIPNLEKQIEQSPALYVQAVIYADKLDDGEDPPEWRIEDRQRRKAVALVTSRLLNRLKRIPGTDASGMIDAVELTTWLNEVRHLCREYACVDIGDYRLGRLLAKAPRGENGIWPCEAICKAMEEIVSPENQIGRGFYIGVLNSRGIQTRSEGEGGRQERDLAAKYRAWAAHLRFDYPYVSGVLDKIAKHYEHEAKSEDTETDIHKRLLY